MSGQQNTDNPDTLFSFELLVEYIRIEKHCEVSNELAVGVRLLDFQTLLIYQPQQQQSDGGSNQSGYSEKKSGMYAFNRGKSCFFKMNLNSLRVHLSNIPLYAMVLDVTEEIPKLVGSSLISLAKAMDRLTQNVTERGVSSPSSHRERGLVVAICNLVGEKIGAMSLSYKLLCLGASLLPHITEREAVPRGQPAQEHVKETNKSASQPLDSGNVCSPTSGCSGKAQIKGEENANALLSKERKNADDDVFAAAKQRPQDQAKNDFEEDLTVFNPPLLYYSAREKGINDQSDHKSWNLDSEAPLFEDVCSREEEESPSSPATHPKVRHHAKISNQETSRMPPNDLRETLQQMPLLNALLIELSQLHGNQPLSVHPRVAWIYRPASTEPSAGNTSQNMQTKSLKTRQETFPHLRHTQSPRNCSTPIVSPRSARTRGKQEEMLIESKSSCKSHRKKLVCGTTKTVNLRLKQSFPFRVNRRECVELTQNETQLNKKAKSGHKIITSVKRKSTIKQSSDLSENIETVMQSITRDCALQRTVTLKQKKQHGEVEGKQCRDSQRTSAKSLLSERDSKCIHIPSLDTDSVRQSKDKSEHHSESDQSLSESDRRGDKTASSRSSRRSSSKSSFSDSSGDGNEEADYVDDFNSLESSDACSPDPLSSPEPSRVKTPKSPVRSSVCYPDSGSESVHRRLAILPVPIKALSSPQHTLSSAHIIRPRTRTSALSFSSEDGDRDGSASLQSRKQMSASGRVEVTSDTESLISSTGRVSVLAKNSVPVRGLSADSVSSFEPQEMEELEDELGSLDFRKEYQHISELVANKLPGYTM